MYTSCLKDLQSIVHTFVLHKLYSEADIINGIIHQAAGSFYLQRYKREVLKLIKLCMHLEDMDVSNIVNQPVVAPFSDLSMYGYGKIEVIDYLQRLFKAESATIDIQIADASPQMMTSDTDLWSISDQRSTKQKIYEGQVMKKFWDRLYEIFKEILFIATKYNSQESTLSCRQLRKSIAHIEKGLLSQDFSVGDTEIIQIHINESLTAIGDLEASLQYVARGMQIELAKSYVSKLRQLYDIVFDVMHPIVRVVVINCPLVGMERQDQIRKELLADELNVEYKQYQQFYGLKSVHFKLAVQHYKRLEKIVDLVRDWNQSIKRVTDIDRRKHEWIRHLIDINDAVLFPGMTFQEYEDNIMFFSEKTMTSTRFRVEAVSQFTQKMSSKVNTADEKELEIIDLFGEPESPQEQGPLIGKRPLITPSETESIEDIPYTEQELQQPHERMKQFREQRKEQMEEKQLGPEQIRRVMHDMERYPAGSATINTRLVKIREVLIYRYKSSFRSFLYARDNYTDSDERFNNTKQTLQEQVQEKLADTVAQVQWESWYNRFIDSLDILQVQLDWLVKVDQQINQAIRKQVYPVLKLVLDVTS